jgi:hypothetical protein
MATYTLPTASTSILGGVKVDGTTITINGSGVISSASSGSYISPTLTGTTTIQALSEVITSITGATGTVVHDYSSASSIFYHTDVGSNFTVNFTNMPVTNGRSYLVTLIIIQGNSPYIPNLVSVDGVSQNIYWGNNVQPAGTALKKEFFAFTLLRINNAWVITAGVTSFG